mmetsp:Transcript_6443/g.9391  ORF Transcript_6443/g.9391 Transcript_6443/m.9391 type:complete len:156 (+) Transcript_6443:93-560(+)
MWSLLPTSFLEWSIDNKKDSHSLTLNHVPFPSFSSKLSSKQKALLVISDENQWKKLKEDIVSSKMVTNVGIQQLLLLEVLDNRVDDIENLKMRNRLSHEKNMKEIQSFTDGQNSRNRNLYNKNRFAANVSNDKRADYTRYPSLRHLRKIKASPCA